MPPGKHRAGETSGGMPPPEHRLKGSVRGAVMPQLKHRGKGTGSAEKAAGAGPIRDIPLANLSNLIGYAGIRQKEPPTPSSTTEPVQIARERKYTRPWSSSFPRDPSRLAGQQLRSTKSNNRRRHSLLSIADSFISPSPDDQLDNTGAGRLRATREKPATGLSAGLMPPSPRLTVKVEAQQEHQSFTGSNVETPQKHQAVAGSSGGTPQKHQAVAGSSGGTPQKHQAVAGSGGGTPRKHQAVAGSSAGTPRKHQAVAGSSWGAPHKHQAVTGPSRGMPRKQQAVMGLNGDTTRKQQAVRGLSWGAPLKHQTVTGSSGGMPHKQQAVMGLNGDTPRKQQAVTSSSGVTPHKHQVVTGSSGGMPRKNQVVTGSSGGRPRKNQMKEKASGAFSGEMPQKIYIKESTKPFPQLRHPPGTQRARTIAELPATRQKKHSERNASVPKSLLTGQKPRKTGSKHGNTITKDNKKSTANENGSLSEEMLRNKQEADHAIQQLNEMGLGYDISYEEFEGYLQLLPCDPPQVDTSLQPDYEQLNELQVRNIQYRIKYCKFTRQRRKNNEVVHNAKLEDDHPLYLLEEKLGCLEEDVTKLEGDQLLDYLVKEGLLRQIENNDIFDWSFLYRTIAGLDDYQRLAPQNYGGCEYDDWDTYYEYFHSYEIELEYLRYWKELLKELKWLKDFVLMKRPSLKWGKICTRGCYQAIKIASCFTMITESLARGAYYDCIDVMCLDIIWYDELDGLYFEIWQRTTKLKESFKEALNEVYKLEKFPLRHHKMKDALENDCSAMEKEFLICTAGITVEVTEDKGRELIAYAIRNQRERPKFYAQYIEKKIEVAKAIGVIPT